MAASSFARCVFITAFLTCNFYLSVEAKVMRLFEPNPPDFVNVSDLKSSLQGIVENIGGRLRCVEHGLKNSECSECLKTDNLIRLLDVDPSSKSFTKQTAEDISVLLAHHILYFESVCTSDPPGCADFQQCQGELLQSLRNHATVLESMVKVLRIFKTVLNEDEDNQCVSAEQILDESSVLDVEKDEKRHMLTILMGHILQGHCIDPGEFVSDFLDDIFHHYGDTCSPYMKLDGLKRMIHDLQNIGQDGAHGHKHTHNHPHSHENSHACEHNHRHFDHHHSQDHHHSDHMHNGLGHGEHYFYDHNDHSGHNHDHADHNHSNADHGHNHSAEQDSHKLSIDTGDRVTLDVALLQLNKSSEITNATKLYIEKLSSIIAPSINVTNNYVLDQNKTDENATEPSEKTIDLGVTVVYAQAADVDNNITSARVNTSYVIPRINMGESTVESVDPNETVFKSEHRNTRSTPLHLGQLPETKDFNAPSASLKSDFSHQEERHDTGEDGLYHGSVDDVKKVYLLQNDENNRMELSLEGDPHRFASLASKCLSAEDLLLKFGHQSNSSLTKSDFLDLCPALIQQIVSGVCTDIKPPITALPTRWEVYGYGSLSVFIISLTSLAGVLLLPIMTKHAYNYIISGFYGLAFSTLAGDALLHLMPQFLGIHSHGPEEDHGHSHDEAVFLEPYVQLQLGVFFTIYGLFLFEGIMCAFTKKDPHAKSQESKGHGHSHAHLTDELPTLISVKTKSETQLQPVSRDQSTTSLDTEIVEVEAIKKPPNLMVAKPVCLGLTSLAIVVTLGDSIHNFGDGLAIGAAFSTGVRGGLSTAIAVFCHELPHEFGDFVVLLSTGLSFSKALWINFLSGLTCFAGLYIGILIGDHEIARKWVMAVTAGIFLYVALGEMLPELREHSHGSPVKMLLVKNIGILAGIAIMVVISIYESEIA